MGCPCCGDCCDAPETFNDHECDDSCEDICEEAYVTECSNCGASCCCDL